MTRRCRLRAAMCCLENWRGHAGRATARAAYEIIGSRIEVTDYGAGAGSQGLVATPGGVALVLVDYLAVRPERIVGVLAPVGTLGNRNGWIRLGLYVEALPAEVITAVLPDHGQGVAFHGHAPFAAASRARFTAT